MKITLSPLETENGFSGELSFTLHSGHYSQVFKVDAAACNYDTVREAKLSVYELLCKALFGSAFRQLQEQVHFGLKGKILTTQHYPSGDVVVPVDLDADWYLD